MSERPTTLGAVTIDVDPIDVDPIDGEATGGRKARGAFFTPPALCHYLARWAVRDGGDRVLEPSCGEAAFLVALAERLRGLGSGTGGGTGSGTGGGTGSGTGRAEGRGVGRGSGLRAGRLHGVELHRASALRARAVLAAAGFPAEIEVADFLQLEPSPVYDAVVGNPPYVRYQDFSGEARTRGRQAALRAGVRLTNLASSWAAFTVHATLFLRPGGRLALVLPAELLSVNYAAQVREFLMQRFGRVRLVLFTERVFPGVLEEVVLLLAEGAGPTDHCELVQVRDVDELLAAGAGDRGGGVPLAAGHRPGQVDPGDDPRRGPRGLRGRARARRVHHPADLGRDDVGRGHREQPVLRPIPPAGRPGSGWTPTASCCRCPRRVAGTCGGWP